MKQSIAQSFHCHIWRSRVQFRDPHRRGALGPPTI